MIFTSFGTAHTSECSQTLRSSLIMTGLHTIGGRTTISALAKHMEPRERRISFTLSPMFPLWTKSCFKRKLSSPYRDPSPRYLLSVLSILSSQSILCWIDSIHDTLSLVYSWQGLVTTICERLLAGPSCLMFLHVFAFARSWMLSRPTVSATVASGRATTGALRGRSAR